MLMSRTFLFLYRREMRNEKYPYACNRGCLNEIHEKTISEQDRKELQEYLMDHARK